MPQEVLLIECDGTQGWVTPARANKMIRDGIVTVLGHKPLRILEKPRIRIMRSRFGDNSHSARYLTSGGFALALYRESLRQTLQMSTQGKPAGIEATEWCEIQKQKAAAYVRTPHGYGR